jgi:hypothetical protein
MIFDHADDHEALVALVLDAWLGTCAADVIEAADLERLARTVAELIRLAAEGVTPKELRLVAAARLATPEVRS